MISEWAQTVKQSTQLYLSDCRILCLEYHSSIFYFDFFILLMLHKNEILLFFDN